MDVLFKREEGGGSCLKSTSLNCFLFFHFTFLLPTKRHFNDLKLLYSHPYIQHLYVSDGLVLWTSFAAFMCCNKIRMNFYSKKIQIIIASEYETLCVISKGFYIVNKHNKLEVIINSHTIEWKLLLLLLKYSPKNHFRLGNSIHCYHPESL